MYSKYFIIKHEDWQEDNEHKYLEFTNKRVEGRIPYVVLLILDIYITNLYQSANSWKSDKRLYQYHWTKYNSEKKITSDEYNYRIFLDYIKKNNRFDPRSFNLPVLSEDFLDISTSAGSVIHKFANSPSEEFSLALANHEQYLGEDYPIVPKLTREGFFIGSFFNEFISKIIIARIDLVNTSEKCFSFDWFFKFRDIINDSIASIEITLNLIYNKAEFNPLPNWNFDKDKLGPKYGRRFKDKLKWVKQISGNNLDIEKYSASLLWLQELRNHLNHFDPPGFCITLEECASVLNAVIDIGMIHIAIRKALGLRLSVNLINWVLNPIIVFSPEAKFMQRMKFDEQKEGYNTCRWPKS